MTAPSTRPPLTRPFTLKMVCLLLALRGLGLLALVALYVLGRLNLTDVPVLEDVAYGAIIVGAAAIAALDFIAAVGLWRLRPWAWRLTMLFLGGQLLVGLWAHFNNGPAITQSLGLLLNILIVFYLVQGDVRAIFVKPTAATP